MVSYNENQNMFSEEGFHVPELGEHFVNVPDGLEQPISDGLRCPDTYT